MENALEILLVDDDDLDRAAVRRCLQAAGVEVRLVEVTDAPEALTTLTSRDFDCVLLDYHLPKSDGLTVLRSARQAGVTSPVIMLTGQDDASTAVAIMKAGALDYIVKTALSPERLAQSLRQAARVGRAERRATEAQLERDRQYEKAQQAVRSRDDLLATVSHDLRSPVSTILMTGILLRKQPGAGEGTALARYAGAITRAAEEMDRLIRDLLDIAAIEAGQLSVNVEPQQTRLLISNAVERAQTAALAKKVELRERGAATAAWVLCDGARIAQVFANLLGNAIKFTPAGGAITVASSDDGDHVTFTVSDTAGGIDPVALPHVFDRFWKSKERAEAGTGLGLAICQGIVSQHGAQLHVDSKVGVGTTFSFALPTCPAGQIEKAHAAPAVF